MYGGFRIKWVCTLLNRPQDVVCAHVVMPRVHRVASLLDRWWLGIYQGAILRRILNNYLGEFTFRFNSRTSRARGLLFYRLMEQAVDCAPVPRQMIVGGRLQHIVGS